MTTRTERLAEIKARKEVLRTQKSSTDRELGQITAEEKDLEQYELEDLEKEAAAIRARLGLPVAVQTEGTAQTAAPGNKKGNWFKRNLIPKKSAKKVD